jgi:hypothetical protein
MLLGGSRANVTVRRQGPVLKLLLASASLLAASCGEGSEGAALACREPVAPVGEWKRLLIPETFYESDPVVRDSESLVLMHGTVLAELDFDALTWSLLETESSVEAIDNVVLASRDYIFSPGILSVGEDGVPRLGGPSALLKRGTREWTVVDKPASFVSRSAQSFSTGRAFGIWGGAVRVVPSDALGVEPDTEMAFLYEGLLLDPETLEWTEIPPAREPGHYLWGDGGPSPASLWTEAGLFVWGMTPDRRGNWGAIFDVDTMAWRELEVDNVLPPLRIEAKLLTVGSSVYLYGGMTPSGEPSRRLFRYALSEDVWTELEVPAWADPSHGAVVDEKLVFLGRCASGARFDPRTGRWDELGWRGRPPSFSGLWAAGSALIALNVHIGHALSEHVWFLDLRE